MNFELAKSLLVQLAPIPLGLPVHTLIPMYTMLHLKVALDSAAAGAHGAPRKLPSQLEDI